MAVGGVNIYGQLVNAQLERLAATPSSAATQASRVIWDTTEGRAKIDNGSAYRAFLLNDDKLVIGTSGTANTNIRLHRGATSVLQLVRGGDTTNEGTLSTDLAQLSAKVENYTTAGRPSAANAGRLYWDTTLSQLFSDTGAAWHQLLNFNQTEDATPALNDQLVTWDSSASGTKYVQLQTLLSMGLQPGFVFNLGITYSAGTLTVCGADATALSASNPGFVVLQSKANPGRLKLYKVTANQAFIDDAGASEIIGNLFGVTTGIAWAQDVPFFIYAVGNDNEDTIAFMLSRDPRATVSPADSAIGAPDDPVADTETSFFSFDNLDETLYDANPCAAIGAIRMRMSASDDWTVQTLSNADGIGQFHDATEFTYPQGQNGAQSTSHMLPNGGSVPEFTTEAITYWISRSGKCTVLIDYDADAGTDGSGANTVHMTMPYIYRGSQATRFPIYINSAGAGSLISFLVFAAGGISGQLVSEAGSYQFGTFSHGARTIRGQFTYEAFGGG
jgi:hypothetical protein